MASSFDRLKELNLSRDEVNRIGDALKNQEFRKLLCDYVEEIQDPKNRQIYEEEVKQIERERGQEVTFLHPTPAYVIKTSVNGNQKGFINICSNTNVGKPTSSPVVKDGARGLQWSLPHSLSPPQEDLDNKGARCRVFDVLFHPDTLHLASKNVSFRSMVNNTALDAIENNFGVNLDKKNIKFPKLNYKGVPRASIMRKPTNEPPLERSKNEQELYDKIYAEIDSKRKNSPKKTKVRRNSDEDSSTYTTPKYVIKHRSHLDIQEFTQDKDAKMNVTVPKELILEINLPLLKSSTDINLDVTEKTVQLISEKPAKYKLNLTLPYQVNEVNGTAKFDKELKKLVITLPVKRKNTFDFHIEDSGVESDPNSPASPDSEEEFGETNNKLISEIKNSDKHSVELREQYVPDSRTKSCDDFLNASDLYNLPEFTCNTFDNIIAFTFNVKNVDSNTVYIKCCPDNSLIKVKFTSISSSFYPSCYAFYVKFPHHKYIEDDVCIETWDNNVILQVPLMNCDTQLLSYFYGSNENNLTENLIEEPAVLNKILEQPQQTQPENNPISKENKTPEKNIMEEAKDIKQEQDPEFKEPITHKLQSKAIDICSRNAVTSCESSGDEWSASSFSPRRSKGILKRIPGKRGASRAAYGRSMSESSLDDFFCSSFENTGSIECVPEEEEENMSSSLKKTVRFNDVVTRQLFRSNSSILGQKKKNQRKAKNKKRAHERRYSESEASDVETKKEGDTQTNDKREDRNSSNDKKEDGDIFHLEINN